ncbi:ATP-binding protein [Megalodesulfovibrio paquesii]
MTDAADAPRSQQGKLAQENALLRQLLQSCRATQRLQALHLSNQHALLQQLASELDVLAAPDAADTPGLSFGDARRILESLQSLTQEMQQDTERLRLPEMHLPPPAPPPSTPSTPTPQDSPGDLPGDLEVRHLILVNNALCIEACSLSWADSLQTPPAPLLGSPLQQHLPAASFKQLHGAITRCLRSEQPEYVILPAAGGATQWNVLPLLPTTDQVETAALLALAPLGPGPAAQWEQDARGQFEAIFEHAAEPVIIHDLDGDILRMNQAASRILGVPRQQAGELSMGQFLAQDMAIYLAAVATTEAFQSLDTEFRVQDGRTLPMGLRVSRLCINNTPAVLCIGRDDSELRRLESYLDEARQAMELSIRMKNEFLTNISHELRTPLSAIVGFADLLGKGSLNASQRLHVNLLLSAAAMLDNLIKDLLDISKLEAGMLGIEQEPFSLAALLSEIKETFILKAAQKQIGFHFTIDASLPDCLLGAPLRLRQILFNLVSNAIKFTNHGAVGIEVNADEVEEIFSEDVAGAETTEPRQLWVHFAVTDSGIGIHERDVHRIFQRFVQVEGAENRRYEGTGLGLTISKNLVELMGGSIWVKSTPGRGSVFHFTIPLRRARWPEPLPASDVPEYPPPIAPMVILLVEDNDFNRDMIVAMTELEGHVVRCARDGLEALELLSAFLPDLVLMDLQMPRCDGFEATRRIRAHANPRIASLPIIALSAHGQEDVPAKCEALGMMGFLAKPFRLQELHTILRSSQAQGLFSQSPQSTPSAASSPEASPRPTDQAAPADIPEPSPAPALALPRFDMELLRANLGNQAEFLQYACSRFLDHARALHAGLDAALDTQDRTTLARLGHTIKSVAGTVGGVRGSQLGRTLETLAKGQASWEAVSLAATALQDELEALRQEIHTVQQTLSNQPDAS